MKYNTQTKKSLHSIKLISIFTFLFILCGVSQIKAQSGFFNPAIDLTVYDVALQPDGKIMVGGDFSNVGGQPRTKVARLNSDGTLDTSFQNPQISGNSTNDDVFAIALQADGKVLIGGLFTTVGGQTQNYLARLNSDGSLDTSFAPIVNELVGEIAVQTDGKILISGYFTSVNGQTRNRAARLNADGTLDTTFQDPVIGGAFNVNVSALAVQSDGKILVGGNFTSVGGHAQAFVTRLNSNGTIDSGFSLNISGEVTQFLLQTDGKIFVSGFFQNVNGVARTSIARINSDGSLDTSFQNTNIPSGTIFAMDIQANGKIMVGGNFSDIAGVERRHIARLNSDGTFDATFTDPNANFGGDFISLNSIIVQPDQKILVGGQFNMVGRQTFNNLVRLDPDGTLDQPPAETFTVTKTADTDDGVCDADCSLREAVATANANVNSSLINFSLQAFGSGQTITLTAGELVFEPDREIIIEGPGAALLTISGNNASRIMRLKRDVNLTLSGITLSNGNGVGGFSNLDGGAIYVEPNGVVSRLTLEGVTLSNNTANSGGGIYTNGTSTLIINNSLITANDATFNQGGGGIRFNNGTIQINNTTISNNTANFQAGGAGGATIGNAEFSITNCLITGNMASSVGGLGVGGTGTISNTIITDNQASVSTGGLGVAGTATLIDSTVTNNTALGETGRGGGINSTGSLMVVNSGIEFNSAAFGGGIFTAGGLNLENTTVKNNSASDSGGGIYNNIGSNNSPPVTVTGSLISENTTARTGGGIFNRDKFILTNSTVSGNTSGESGGGVFNLILTSGAGEFTAVKSTFSGNSTNTVGGGFANQSGTINLINSTVSGNISRASGSGIRTNTGGTVNLENSTIAFNETTLSGGSGVSNSESTINAQNTIIARNVTGTSQMQSDFIGVLNSNGYNLIGTTNGTTITGVTTGNLLNVDPLLAPLELNSGTTKTHGLRSNSPAIDAGSAIAEIQDDQRGKPRPFDFPAIPNASGSDGSDIGAFERQENDVVANNARFDLDGDGKTDIGIFRPAPGEWWYLNSSDNSAKAFQFGSSTDRIVPADFTGDGKTDIAFWRESTGFWFVLRSEDSSFFAFPFGTAGDIPAPGDFDGDGTADPAVFRPSNATWSYIRSSDGQVVTIQFGLNGDQPIVEDYDGDGKDDLAVYRPNAAEWYLLRSQDGFIGFQFGIPNDSTPVPADYTGDGKADIAFFRQSSSEWFVLRSEDSSFFAFPFGTSGDIPVPGDYDGDGTADPAVFRPSNNSWFLQQTTDGFEQVQFGIPNDIPIPSAYVP